MYLPPTERPHRYRKKPDWVRREIIHMKAWMPDSGCRAIADVFNRRFVGRESVGKSFVHGVLVQHKSEIRLLRKKLRNRKPRPVPLNHIWAMDLTGKVDFQGNLHNILGIVEHASRANLVLKALRDKRSVTLLRHLLDAVEHSGSPKFVRTDNEAVFTFRLFRFGLWLLNIRHQRIEKGCPYMNGRVERFFGTLEHKLDQWQVDSLEQLNGALGQFRLWYNHVRPHRNLAGRTPAEVWQGKDIFSFRIKSEHRFEAWDGLLTGYYLRL